MTIGWTLVALGIGASRARLPDREPPTSPSGSLSIAVMPATWPDPERFEAVDLASGCRTPIRLPRDDRWSDVAISPWPGPDGEAEVVGRWVNPDRDDFGGWCVFRLSDGAVLCRVATEVLPTGRPCWVPGRSRMIVFAAADGQLYRCRLDPNGDEADVLRGPVYASGRVEPSDRIAWETSDPASGEILMNDPVWSNDPRLRRWVFVSMMTLNSDGRRREYGPSELWWLELDDEARAIIASGRLTGPSEHDGGGCIDRRRPSVGVGPDGTIRMVYLERRDRLRAWRLRSGVLEFDARTGCPRALIATTGPAPSSRPVLGSAPLTLLSDGSTVYGFTTSGRIATIDAGRLGKTSPK